MISRVKKKCSKKIIYIIYNKKHHAHNMKIYRYIIHHIISSISFLRNEMIIVIL